MAKKPLIRQYQINFSEPTPHFDAPTDTYEEKQEEIDQQNFLNEGPLADAIIAHFYKLNESMLTASVKPPIGKRGPRKYPRYKLPPHINAQG